MIENFNVNPEVADDWDMPRILRAMEVKHIREFKRMMDQGLSGGLSAEMKQDMVNDPLFAELLSDG